jgi:hypothetical protein
MNPTTLSLSCWQQLSDKVYIPELVKDLSAEFDHLKIDVVTRLQALVAKLKASRSAGNIRTINEASNKFVHLTPAQLQSVSMRFQTSVQNAAPEGCTSFVKHVEPTHGHYILRMRYIIAVEPGGSDDSDEAIYNRTFFGC